MRLSVKLAASVAGAITVGAVATASAYGAMGQGPLKTTLSSDSSSAASKSSVSKVDSHDTGSGATAAAASPKATAQPGTTVPETLKRGQKLTAGKYLRAKDGKYFLLQQKDGNLVVLNSSKKPVWSSQTNGHSGAYTTMTGGGDVRVMSTSGGVLWRAATAGSTLVMQTDGNAVVYSSAHKSLWGSQQEKFTLYSGQFLTAGQRRTSPNGQYYLVQQPDGNLVEYAKSGTVLWSSQTNKNSGAGTSMNADGNLVVYGAGRTPLYSTATNQHSGAVVVVQNDGNVVLLQGTTPVWGTLTEGVSKLTAGQTLNAGQSRSSLNGTYRLLQQSDGNLVLFKGSAVVWDSKTEGHAGASTQLQPDGNVVIRDANGTVLWSSNTNGHAPGELNVQNDGNVVYYDSNKTVVWSTNTNQ